MAAENSIFGTEKAKAFLDASKRVVMVGIGGVGMYSIAALLKKTGKNVVGQDTLDSPFTRSLAEMGIPILYHNEAFPLAANDLVIYTLAVSPTHPTLLLAQAMGLPAISRADALAGLMEGENPKIAVAGMHGKSTTTALLSHLLQSAGHSPTTVVGAMMAKHSSPFYIGQKGFLFEACEYMRSFLSFSPDLALILNMEWEHVDCYPTFASVKAAFSLFAGQSKQLVLCYDDPHLRALSYGKPTLFYSLLDTGADLYAKEITSSDGIFHFTLYRKCSPLGEARFPLLGKMNLSNAIGAAAAALTLGVSPESICQSLSSAQGVKRRLEHRGFLGKSPIFDDYAHHPTEITASLCTLREHTKGKLYLVFQPHTYTRTKALFSALAEALALADKVILFPIYPARETDDLGVSSQLLARTMKDKAIHFEQFSEIAEYLEAHLKEEDTAVIMGAGDIDRLFAFLPLQNAKNK